MTTRETKIIKAVLDYLHSLDCGQATELQIHANAFGEAFGEPKPSAGELAVAIRICDAGKWITGVPSRFGGKMKWNINDVGEAARLDLNE
jgi:FKBP-type peptidyl-prolyl cis-trans isomerase 2